MSKGRREYIGEIKMCQKGYGFVHKCKELPNVEFFYHISNVRGDTPIKGDLVKFDFQDSRKGLCCRWLEVIEDVI